MTFRHADTHDHCATCQKILADGNTGVQLEIAIRPEPGDKAEELCLTCAKAVVDGYKKYMNAVTLTDLEQRIHAFRMQIPFFRDGGRQAALRGLGEELGELAGAALEGPCAHLERPAYLNDRFYKEAADIVFVAMGMLAQEGASLTDYLLKKLVRAEGRIPEIIKKTEARRYGLD